MPRYLTPVKLCLLALVDLYVTDQIASGARLGLLKFLFAAISPPDDQDEKSIQSRLSLTTSSVSRLAEEISQWPSTVPGRTLYDDLLHWVWSGAGIDSLHGFFQHLHSLVAQPLSAKPSRASPLGQFIRRCHLEFTRLQFGDTQALWNAFDVYRRPSYDLWALRNPDAARQYGQDRPAWASIRTNEDVNGGNPTPSGLSNDETDMLLSFSIRRLQRLGTRIPMDLRSKLESWIADTQEVGVLSSQQFLAFFDHWRAGQFTMAQESLQRYFDYSLTKQQGPDNMKVYYQYALLHKSILYADFERWEDSVDAMNECIATARENQDAACLNFALSWLIYLRHAYPRTEGASFTGLAKILGGCNGAQDEIDFLKTKAHEGKLWPLLSSTLLDEARREIHGRGSSVKAFEALVQASHLNLVHDIEALMPAVALFNGTIYDRLGQAHMSRRHYEEIRQIYGHESPVSDLARSSCRIALALAHCGRYKRAFQTIEDTAQDVREILKLHQRHQAYRGLIMLHQLLNHSNAAAAEHVVNQLRPVRSFADPELVFEAEMLFIEWLDSSGTDPVALDKLLAKSYSPWENGSGQDIAQHLQLLLLNQRARRRKSNGIYGFSSILRIAAMAMKHMLIPILIEALAELADILIVGLQEFDAAKHLLEAALPFALEMNNVKLTATCFMLLGDTHVGLAAFESVEPPMSRHLRIADIQFKKSREAFTKIENFRGKVDNLVRERQIALISGDTAAENHLGQLYFQILRDRETQNTM